MTLIDKAKVPEEVKEATRRTHLFEEGRVAAAPGTPPRRRRSWPSSRAEVAAKKRPFEVRQQHELAGMVALAEKQYADAAREFQLATSRIRESCISFGSAEGAGDSQRAAQYAVSREVNGPKFTYA